MESAQRIILFSKFGLVLVTHLIEYTRSPIINIILFDRNAYQIDFLVWDVELTATWG